MGGFTGSGSSEREVAATGEHAVAPSDINGAAVSPSELPVFDRDALLSRLDGDDSSVQDFVDLFILSIADHVLHLGAALAEGDATATYYRAHTIGGTAATMGALQMQEVAARLEQLGTDGDKVELSSLYRQLQEAFAAFKSAAVSPARSVVAAPG